MIPEAIEKKLWKRGLPRCEHRSSRVVFLLSASGARLGREQCCDCGKVDSTPLKAADHPDAPPVDMKRANDWNEARREAGEAAAEVARKRYAMAQKVRVEETKDWFEGYGAFLGSDEWAAMRARVLRRDGGLCQAFLPGCTKTATEVHHKSYSLHRTIGMQPGYDLVAICHECHEKITLAERAGREKKSA